MTRRPHLFAASCFLLALILSGCFRQKKEAVDYVNPNIGGIGHLLQPTYPIVKLPYGMMSISPITTPGITDRYLADKIYGFPAGGATLMPSTGPAETDPVQCASLYDHDLETATPYYYAAMLEKYNIQVEYTVSARAAYYRLAFPEGAPAHVLFSVPQGGELSLSSPTSLSGRGGGGGGSGRGGRTSYFYAEFSKPVTSSNKLTEIQIPRRAPAAGGHWPGSHGGLHAGQRRTDWRPDWHIVHQHRPSTSEPDARDSGVELRTDPDAGAQRLGTRR